jgi:hypothetical protein
VISKLIKLCLTICDDNISAISKKKQGDLVECLKSTIKDCYLNENSKLAKVSAKILAKYQKKT